MSQQKNHGVIETASGDLLHAGYSELEWDPETETFFEEVPIPSYCRRQLWETRMSRWTGTEWIVVDQP